MLIGYARVSTTDQKLTLQQDALRRAGCQSIFTDVASGAQTTREGLTEVLEFLRERDTLVVWKLDRLGRSLPHLLAIVTALQKRQIGFRSLQEHMDTTTSGDKLVFHVFGALAEFERDLVQERTRAGLEAARARGKKGGQRRVMDAKKVAMAVSLLQNLDTSVTEVCRTLRVSRATLYRYLSPHNPPVSRTLSSPNEDAPTKRKKTPTLSKRSVRRCLSRAYHRTTPSSASKP